MMFVNLKKQVEDWRVQDTLLIKERAEEEERKAENHQSILSRRADTMIAEVYKDLNIQILNGVGLGDVESWKWETAWNYISDIDDRSEGDGKVVQALVKERCGLNLTQPFPDSASVKERNILMVNLRGEVKAYSFEKDGEVVRLDFPALFAENQRRNRIWAQEIGNVAREVLDQCQKCLAAMEDKEYGIEEEMKMAERMVWSWFSDRDFAFGGKRLPYSRLTKQQLKELKQAVDEIMSGGEIEFWYNSDKIEKVFWVSLLRRPEKVVKDAYYDYQEFCQTYDEVTESLQKTFDKIIAGLKLIDSEEQIAVLNPERILCFNFADYPWQEYFNYGRVKNGLSGRRHGQSLVDAVNQRFPAIFVTDICFMEPEKRSMNEGKIKLKYVITQPFDDFIEGQVAAEEMIEHIKTRRATYLARVVAETLLEDVKEVGISWLFKNGYPTRRYYHLRLTKILLNGKAQGYSVNIEGVTDDAFIKRVEREVNRLTDGVLMVDIRLRYFKLNFDKNIASAEHPITLREFDERF